ncbi:inorganic phosphate transporter [Streptomyces sp. NBC_00193]|uniref:inorganic phosphate transporter n=1 Tax=Streptomyces sp. NBC_00193 TaxID=2975675 RepID=UPI0022513C44|nr:inorganic phosphate transporter [Streptomyces sp. NBC_00193]MCX5301620.1 inorganic phosphate transporter [Streptomyces sp. NBC_00193]
MDSSTTLIAVTIAVALLFDFTNGFHDTANAVATAIATGALRPKVAVAMSAVCNLAGAFVSVAVAKTISGGIIDEHAGIRPPVILAALAGAVLWNLATWLLGIPSSSSHALVGGLIGATVASVGLQGVDTMAVVGKILVPAVLSPLIGGVVAYAATRAAGRLSGPERAERAEHETERAGGRGARAGQVLAAALVSLAHGTGDGQKTMGVITLTLVTAGSLPAGSAPPLWVIVTAGLTMALGTYTGGWRIIRTLGTGLTRLGPRQGCVAQTSAAAVLLTTSHLGFAVSTTHAVTGSVAGAGLATPGGVLSRTTVRAMLVSWVLTLPAAGLVAALAVLLTEQGAWGQDTTAALLVCATLAFWARSRRTAVTARNVAPETATAADTATATAGSTGAATATA